VPDKINLSEIKSIGAGINERLVFPGYRYLYAVPEFFRCPVHSPALQPPRLSAYNKVPIAGPLLVCRAQRINPLIVRETMTLFLALTLLSPS
jgi:hypothetical protein